MKPQPFISHSIMHTNSMKSRLYKNDYISQLKHTISQLLFFSSESKSKLFHQKLPCTPPQNQQVTAIQLYDDQCNEIYTGYTKNIFIQIMFWGHPI